MTTTYKIIPPSFESRKDVQNDTIVEIFDAAGASQGWRYVDRKWFAVEVAMLADPDKRSAYLIARDECIDRGFIREQ